MRPSCGAGHRKHRGARRFWQPLGRGRRNPFEAGAHPAPFILDGSAHSLPSPEPAIRTRIFYGWYIVFAAAASLFIQASTGGFTFSIFLAAMNADLGWPRSTLVLSASITAVTAALAGPWIGRFVDRRGPRAAMAAAVVAMAGAFFAAAAVQQPWQFYLAVGLVSGAARSALQSVIPGAMIASWWSRRRATAYSIAAMGPPCANLVLPPLMSLLVTAGGWRTAWTGLGAVALLAGLAPALLIARRIEGTGWLPDGDAGQPAPPRSGAAREAAPGGGDWTLREALRSRTFWLVAVGMSLILMAPNTSILFLFSYLSERGMDASTATFAISLASGLQVVTRLFFWGPFTNRLGGVRWVLVLWGCLLLVSSLLFGLAQEGVWAMAAVVVLGCALGGNLVLILQVWPEYFGRTAVGAIIGTAQMVQGMAQAFGPLALASLLDATGSYSALYLTLAGLAVAGVVCLTAAGKPRRPTPVVGSAAAPVR